MVGGLVEQEHVGLLQEKPAQRDAAALTAGNLGDVGITGRTAQRVHGDFKRAVQLPRIGVIDLVLELSLLFEERVHLVVAHRLGELHADFLEALEECPRLRHRLFDIAENVLLRVEDGLLREVSNFQARERRAFALNLGVDAGHDAQKRTLARAVGAQYADLGAGQEGERDVVQDHAIGRDDFFQFIERANELMRHGDSIFGILGIRNVRMAGAVAQAEISRG